MMSSDASRRGLRLALTLTAALLLPQRVCAHAGHDHADVPPPPLTVEPRFSTHAGEVEVTGVRGDGVLWLYVNRYASNAPWEGLAVEVEIDGETHSAQPAGAGLYRCALGAGGDTPAGETQPVIVSLSGDGLEELLVADLPAAKPE